MCPMTAVLTLALAAPPANDPAAERIGLKAHADAAAFDKLPRFDYQAKYCWGHVETMRAEPKVGLDELTRALTGEISQKRGEGLPWYEHDFSWDQTRFLTGTRPGDADLGINTHFGTRTDGWDRSEAKDHSRVRFTRRAGVGAYWDMVHCFDLCYLRLSPHRYWWGETSFRTHHTMTHQPLAGAIWAMFPAEPFAGEPCDIVEASGLHGRFQRLWVSKASGRVRGVLTFFSGPDDPNELARFDDYHEVAPGVWVPFAEARTYSRRSEKAKGKHQLIRSELRVTAARTGVDLSARYAALLPKPGDRVQDQRFATAVNTKYDPKRPDADIQREADAEYAKQLEDAELVKALVAPVAKLVGKPAPPLPADGWVGGTRPEVAGKPHLLHFWATWCGPCKNDLPRLKALAATGVLVVGMHPAGTPADEVAAVVREMALGYPTLVPAGNGERSTVAGYPAGMYPYCLVVDAQGKVVGHGSLADVLAKFDGLLRP